MADNGKEFAYHEEVGKALLTDVYFARICSSWGRDMNESTNGVVRQYFPKNTGLKVVTNTAVKKAINLLTYRPGKDLGLKAPGQLVGAHRLL